MTFPKDDDKKDGSACLIQLVEPKLEGGAG
jgi:hypothetical protein